MKTEVLQVNGMTCGGCARTVERALSALAGVSKVAVSLARNNVEVQYDEAAVDPSALRATLHSAGYEVVSAPSTAARRGGCCS